MGYIDKQYGLADLAKNTMPYWYESYYSAYSEQFRTETKAIYNLSDKFNITAGFELKYSNIQGNYLVSETENPEEDATNANNVPGGNQFFSRDFGVYAQANYKPIEMLSIVVGGRVDNNKIRITGGYGTVYNPKFALVLTPKNFIFKAIYSSAFMDASPWAKYSVTGSRIANPSLDPEKVANVEASAGWKITDNLFFDIAVYQAKYSNIVGEVTLPSGKTQNQPIGKLTIQGLQSRLNYKINNYSLFVYYTFTNPQENTDTSDVRIGDIASHSICGGVDAVFFKKLSASLVFNYAGEKKTGKGTTISGNPLSSIDPYFIMNFAITYKFYKGFSLQIRANNILNKEYFDPGVRAANGDYYAAESPQDSRNFMARLVFEF
jgi:outer membrane receptor protein involved in Fe transport